MTESYPLVYWIYPPAYIYLWYNSPKSSVKLLFLFFPSTCLYNFNMYLKMSHRRVFSIPFVVYFLFQNRTAVDATKQWSFSSLLVKSKAIAAREPVRTHNGRSCIHVLRGLNWSTQVMTSLQYTGSTRGTQGLFTQSLDCDKCGWSGTNSGLKSHMMYRMVSKDMSLWVQPRSPIHIVHHPKGFEKNSARQNLQKRIQKKKSGTNVKQGTPTNRHLQTKTGGELF